MLEVMRTLYERSGKQEENKYITPRVANELYKEKAISKLVGLDKLKDKDLIILSNALKKTFAEVMNYRNDINYLIDKYVELDVYTNDYDIRALFEVAFTTCLDEVDKKGFEKIYLIRDIVQNSECKLEIRFRDWVYSFGNEHKEKLWYDERHITFLKMIDEINYLLYQRKEKNKVG